MKRLVALLLVCLLAGCSANAPVLSSVLPSAGAVPGWSPAGNAETYQPERLFDLVDGAVDSYNAYGFEQVAVGTYRSEGKPDLRVEVWQLDTPPDAYGLFTTAHSGTPVSLGNTGALNSGQELVFWQERYFVRVRAFHPAVDSDLQAFGRAVSGALPAGGERPALVKRLPATGLVEDSTVFFRREISIQNRVWLGGDNLLGLGPKTEGVLAGYALPGGTVSLLLVHYPEPSQAAAGLDALLSGKIENVLAADANANLLGAVIGHASRSTAIRLLDAALR